MLQPNLGSPRENTCNTYDENAFLQDKSSLQNTYTCHIFTSKAKNGFIMFDYVFKIYIDNAQVQAFFFEKSSCL